MTYLLSAPCGASAPRCGDRAIMILRTAAFSAIAGVLLTAGLLRWRSWSKTTLRETRYLAVALLAFGAAFLLNVPPVVTRLDRNVLHLADGAILASHLLGLATAWGGIGLCAEVAGQGSRNRIVRSVLVVAIGFALTFVFVRAEPRAETPLFFERYARASQLRVYWMIFIGTIVAATAYLAYIALRHTHHDDRWLRRGLALIGWGASLICLFAASRFVAVLAEIPSWVEPAAITTLSVGAAALAAGASLPHVAAARRRYGARRALYPIWLDATARYPHVRANSQPLSLYRLIIEIQDALAEARSRNELESPLMHALDQLPVHVSDDLDGAVDDLLIVASARRHNPQRAT